MEGLMGDMKAHGVLGEASTSSLEFGGRLLSVIWPKKVYYSHGELYGGHGLSEVAMWQRSCYSYKDSWGL